MRSTIVKRCAVLIGVLSMVAVTVFFIQKFQVGRLARSVAERADATASAGNFEAAAKLYAEHLAVVPDDTEIQIKYADMLLKQNPSPPMQAAAAKVYFDVLRRFPGREDVRRRQMELKFAMKQFIDSGAEADLQMLLSLPQNKTDGDLLFMMGRCREEGKNDLDAKHWYEEAIKYDGPRKIEACQRLAALLREASRLNDPKAADQVVDDMVRSSPEDYHVLPGARSLSSPVWPAGCQRRHREGIETDGRQARDYPRNGPGRGDRVRSAGGEENPGGGPGKNTRLNRALRGTCRIWSCVPVIWTRRLKPWSED